MMGAFNAVGMADSSVERILDVGADLMLRYGLTRWTMEDVAERATIGRTSVYRSFASCDDLVHAVLARELRTTMGRITAAAAAADLPRGRHCRGGADRAGRPAQLIGREAPGVGPGTILPFLTTSAGPPPLDPSAAGRTGRRRRRHHRRRAGAGTGGDRGAVRAVCSSSPATPSSPWTTRRRCAPHSGDCCARSSPRSSPRCPPPAEPAAL